MFNLTLVDSLDSFCSLKKLEFKGLDQFVSDKIRVFAGELELLLPLNLQYVTSEGKLTERGKKHLLDQLDVFLCGGKFSK